MADIEISGIPLSHRKGLWFAEIESPKFGVLEAVLDGSKDLLARRPIRSRPRLCGDSSRIWTRTCASCAAACCCRSCSVRSG